MPTAQYQTVTNESEALTALQGRSLPIVIKADGLAAGKGVVIAETLADGLAAVRRFFKQGRRQILIEDYLVGEESVSYTHLRAHETLRYLVCRLLLEKKKKK